MNNILIVEDEQVTVLDLEETLGRLGYEVVGSASSGETAVALAEAKRPDLVLMDIMLRGEMSGLLAAGLIRERLGIPIIFLTAYANHETLAAARATDPAGYILKPYQERELNLAIEMALTRHELNRDLLASEKRFEETFEHPAVGLALVSTTGGWLRVNRTLCSILGYSRQDLLALNFRDITHPDDFNSDLGDVQRLLDGVIRSFSVQKRYRRRDGSFVSLRLSVKLARRADGSPDYFVSLFQD